MRQVCNVIYHMLTDGKSKAQIAEVEVALAGPRDRDTMIGRQNEESMRQLQSLGAAGFIPPPKNPRRKAT